MKEEQEFIVIKSFKDHYPDFPKGRIIKSESPDFIVRNGPKYKIGIELVQLIEIMLVRGKDLGHSFKIPRNEDSR